MKPSLSKIVNSIPSPVDVAVAIVHVNHACGIEIERVNGRPQTKGLPTAATSYAWSDIFDEITAQGFVPAGGEFYRKEINQ